MSTDEQRLLIALEARFNKYEKDMAKAMRSTEKGFGGIEKRAQTAGKRMEDSLSAASSRVGGVLRNFGVGLLGGVAAGGLAGIVTEIGAVAKGIASIGDEAKRAGVSVKAFQEWSHVANTNRISVDALADGFKELNIRADEFVKTSKGSAAEAFERLGLSPAQVKERIKDPSTFMLELIERTRALKDVAARTRIFDELFGGTGAEQMVRLIDQGAASIKRTMAEANELGLVLDEQMIAKAAEIDRQFGVIANTVSTRLKGAIVTATVAMMDFWQSLKSNEEANTKTLGDRLAVLGRKRLEQENRLLSAGDGRHPRQAGLIRNQARAELERIAKEEAQILTILGQREKEIGDQAAAAAPQVQQLGTSLTTTGSATSAGVKGLSSFTDAIRELKGEIPELAEQLATLDARAKIDQAYRSALGSARSIGDTITATNLRDQALSALATKDAREASGKGLLALISHYEGTSGAAGYNTSLAHGKFLPGGREQNLTGMTLDQIDQLQGGMLAHPGNTYNSSAIGKYQIVRKTLRGLRDELGLSGSEFYTPALQDRLAEQLVRRRGSDPAALRNEWEGLRKAPDSLITQAYNGTATAMPAQDEAVTANQAKAREQVDAYRQIVAGAREFSTVQETERQALGMTTVAAQALRHEQQMLAEAQRANIALTPQQRAEITQLATGMAQAEQATLQYVQSQEQANQVGQFFGEQITGALSGVLTGAQSAEQAVQGLVNSLIDALLQASLLGKGPLAGLFGGGGLLSGLFSGFGGFPAAPAVGLFADGGVVKAATGGHISGPGTGTSDSIPARLSDGEFVVRAAATRKHRALLEAINADKVPGFAAGGAVGGGSAPLLSPSSAAPLQGANIAITVNAAQGGDPAANNDAAKKTSQAIEASVRGLVFDEIRRQARPGGFFNNRSR
jgi:muramidase (phage lysozyme)